MEDALKRWMRGELALELLRSADGLRLRWSGRSNERDPGHFLMPILAESFETARAEGLPLVLDFVGLDYMNSSTFTPVVKALDEARRLSVPIVLEYGLASRWQALSFSALRTFETLDGRIKVTGK